MQLTDGFPGMRWSHCPGPFLFRTPGENASLLRPLIGRNFKVWALPERPAREGQGRHQWRLGVRLGPNAPGAFTLRVLDLGATPAWIRGAGFREVLKSFRSPGQVGPTPSWAFQSWRTRRLNFCSADA